MILAVVTIMLCRSEREALRAQSWWGREIRIHVKSLGSAPVCCTHAAAAAAGDKRGGGGGGGDRDGDGGDNDGDGGFDAADGGGDHDGVDQRGKSRHDPAPNAGPIKVLGKRDAQRPNLSVISGHGCRLPGNKCRQVMAVSKRASGCPTESPRLL